MKEYVDSANRDSDRRYVERFCALEKRLDTAIASIKESTNAAFNSSQKAIDKQEESQRTYNQGHNDLSRKMEDQYKMMTPRSETNQLFKSLEEKMEVSRIGLERDFDVIRDDIKSLRESRSEVGGRGSGLQSAWLYLIALAGLVVAIASLFHR